MFFFSESRSGAECHPGGLALAGAFPLSVVLWIMGLWRAVMVLPEVICCFLGPLHPVSS